MLKVSYTFTGNCDPDKANPAGCGGGKPRIFMTKIAGLPKENLGGPAFAFPGAKSRRKGKGNIMKTRGKLRRSIILMAAIAVLGLPTVALSADLPLDVQGSGIGSILFAGMCGDVSVDDFPVCGMCGDTCLVQKFEGTGKWQHIGIFDWSVDFVVDPAAATSNSAGGFCYPVYAESVHQSSAGDIHMAVTGTLCNVGQGIPSMPYPPLAFYGAYQVTGGTGQYEEASGFGNLAGGVDESFRMLVTINGTLIKDSDTY